MWSIIARIILRNRIALIIAVGIITAFMAYEARLIRLSYKYAQMLPVSDSAYVEYNDFKKLFGEEANIIFIGVQDSSFYEVEKFNDWYDLGNDIKQIEGVSKIASLPKMLMIVKNEEEKKFDYVPVFKNKVTSKQELDSLVSIATSLPFYRNFLYHDTSNINLLWITLSKDKLNSKERIPLIQEIKKKADRFGEKYDLNIRYSGLPYIRTIISDKLKSELNMFVILSLIISVIILYLLFRSFRVVFFSILVVGVGVVWTLGSMVLLGYNITMLTGIIPSLLIVIGIANSIFLLNKYHLEYRNHGNKIKALHRVIQKIGNAIFLTNLTTAAGFATFIITRSNVLVEFGIVASLNIMGIFVLALLLIPIFFSFLPPPEERHTKHLTNKNVRRIVNGLVIFTLNYRRVIYIVTCAIIILGIFGISRMKSTGYMVDDIPHRDKIYKDLKFFEKHFGGVIPIEIAIDTKKRKGVYKLKNLNKINKLQERLKEYPDLSRSASIVDAVKFARQAFYNGSEKAYKLPTNNMDKNFVLSYVKKNPDNDQVLRLLIDSLQRVTRISVQMADIGTVKMEELYNNIKAEIDTLFPKDEYNTTVTGTSIIFFKGTKYLIRNLFISVGLAILLISAFMAWMFTSFRMIVVSLIPNLIPLIITASIMGFFGVAIKPSTILIFSIAFGISVDNTIHFLAKYRQELSVRNWNISESVIAAIKEVGISLMYTSIVLFFGFGIFVASDFGGTKAMGALVSITLFIALLSNLVLLPSLLLSLEKAITTKAFKEPLIEIFDEEEDIELEELKISKG